MRSRKSWALVCIVMLVVGLPVAWWFLWIPNWRPPLRYGERYGIDVSSHQNTVDWSRVADDGITFAYIKATEGSDFTDDRFAANWVRAERAGLDHGAYHFFTLCTPGRDQGRHFIQVAPPKKGALAPAVDLELAGNCSNRPSREAISRELNDFLTVVEAAWGRQALLYVGDDFEGAYPVRERIDRPLWHRRFLLRPNVEGWRIWQIHGYARVEGVSGQVDLNIMRPNRAKK